MQEHEINKLDNFICGWYHNDVSICDKIINFHKSSNKKYTGVVDDVLIIPDVKDSIDCILENDQQLTEEYINYLQEAVELYIEKYPYCNNTSPWSVVQNINVQHYIPPNGGFHKFHCERSVANHANTNRHLVFMTYLNDVVDGGETEFYHQKAKVKPVKGLTLIWPADWTFTHRGLPSLTEEKYIVTGWFSYK
jgi:hypothetical protein